MHTFFEGMQIGVFFFKIPFSTWTPTTKGLCLWNTNWGKIDKTQGKTATSAAASFSESLIWRKR